MGGGGTGGFPRNQLARAPAPPRLPADFRGVGTSHLEICMTLRIPIKMRQGLNKCEWLKISTTERCGKSCTYEFCKVHRQAQRNGSKTPVPCRKCGVGTQSQAYLCRPCGAHRINQKLSYAEKKARRIFPFVLHELLSSPI